MGEQKTEEPKLQSFKMSNRKEVLWVLFLLGCVAAYLGYYVINMEWISGGGDSYSHYQMAKHAYKYPENLLHHWGKPMFTLLASPFAQFGLKGVEFYNLTCYLLAAWFAYKTAKVLNYPLPWWAVIMVMFTPQVFETSFSSLTEPTAAVILMSSTFLFATRRFVWGAVVASFLLMVRTETFIFFPLWALFLAWEKQWKAIPFLASGFVIYSLAGWSYYNDILWVINEIPYSDASDVYGTGSLMHFADSYEHITGKAVGIMLLLGVLAFVFQVVKNRFIKWSFNQKLELLILAMAFGFFAAHSYAWWVGSASAGLLRVMAVIIPLMAVLANKAIDWPWVRYRHILLWCFVLFVSGKTIYRTWQKVYLPIQLHPEIVAYNELTYPIKEEVKNGATAVYFHPYVHVKFDVDFRDTNQAIYGFEHGLHRMKFLQSGDLIIYDNVFWPREGHTPIESLDLSDFDKVDHVKKPLSDGKNYSEVQVWRKR